MKQFAFLCLTLTFSLCCGKGASIVSDEKQLIKKLLDQYQKIGIIGRPVKNRLEKVVIYYGLSLIQILDLDEKNQILTINVWSKYTWIDQLMVWNPSEYSNVTEVRIPPHQIWTPDIVLFNYADERLKEQRDVMVVVDYTGQVVWIPPAIYKSTCEINIQYFPFDQQNCSLKFGSWTYDGFKLDIDFADNYQEINLVDYQVNNAWDIVGKPATRTVSFEPNGTVPYPDLTFYLFLKRNPEFYAYLLVLPCVLLSSLILVIFWLPPESPAKMVLGMNIFVAFFLLLLLLANSTPSASTHIPYIGYYYLMNMILITLSTFLSVIVINLYFRCDKRNPMPNWLKQIVNTLAVVFCMQEQGMFNEETDKINVRRKSKSPTFPITNTNSYPHPGIPNCPTSPLSGTEDPLLMSSISNTTDQTNLFLLSSSGGIGGNRNTAPKRGNFQSNNSFSTNRNTSFNTPSLNSANFNQHTPSFGSNHVMGLIGKDPNCTNRFGRSAQRPNHLFTSSASTKQTDETSPSDTPWLLMDKSTASNTQYTQSQHRSTSGSRPVRTSPDALFNNVQSEEEDNVFDNKLMNNENSPIDGLFNKLMGTPPMENRYKTLEDRTSLHSSSQNIEPDLREIRRSIQNLMFRLGEKDRGNRTAREWRMVALLCDRIFFWTYFITILTAGLVLLLPKEPDLTVEEFMHRREMLNAHKNVSVVNI